MLNFAVGPVQSSQAVCLVGAEQVPYFRTSEFSSIMLENEELICKFAIAPEKSRAVFITGSGTAAMEAAVMNVFTSEDRVLVINGGSFGQRFVQLCKIHDVHYTEIKLSFGEILDENKLKPYENMGYTGLIVNIHETSTGMHYDLELISDFCKRNACFLLVDAISSFMADPIDMEESEIGMLITGSQKALACPPGISIMVLSPKAIDRVNSKNVKCMYFNLKDALKNGERGQTPFTPAVGILRQINVRLNEIEKAGGVQSEIDKIAALAMDFRSRIKDLPFEIVSPCLSNAVTPLHPLNASAYDVFLHLKDEYGIWVCPNGGDLTDWVFRVGHMGALTIEDNKVLINALYDMQKRGII